MLTTNQLIKIFSHVKNNSDVSLDMSFIVDLSKYVKIDIDMTDSKTGYMSKINLLELSKSEIPDDMVYELVNNGWKLSKDKKNIEIFY